MTIQANPEFKVTEGDKTLFSEIEGASEQTKATLTKIFG